MELQIKDESEAEISPINHCNNHISSNASVEKKEIKNEYEFNNTHLKITLN